MRLLDLHAVNHPDKTALICGPRRLTWGELAGAVRAITARLRDLGIAPGQRAAVLASNSIGQIAATAGLRALGVVVIPINTHLTAAEVRYVLEDSGAQLLVCDEAHLLVGRDAATERVLIVPIDDPHGTIEATDPIEDEIDQSGAYIMYTSGTSGRPKGAYHSAGPDVSVALDYIQAFGLTAADVHLVAGPLYHSAPSAFLNINQAIGGTAVVMARFDPEEAVRLIETEGVTSTFMAPILLRRILRLPAQTRSRFDTSTLRSLIVAGAPFPSDLKVQAQKFFGDVIYEFYGSTETKAALYITPKDLIRKLGSCGTPFPGRQVRLRDSSGAEPAVGEVGEIEVLANASSFEGYLGDDEKTRTTIVDGFIRTGDLAYRDEDGFYFICGRDSDLVISGGVNIYPAEVEAALMQHPAIEDAAVIGVPDEEWGESLHAFVQVSSRLKAEQIDAFLRERIAGYKVPRSWEFVSALPRSDDGKLRKSSLLPKPNSVPTSRLI